MSLYAWNAVYYMAYNKLSLQVSAGWKCGDSIDEQAKTHPLLKAYKALSEKVHAHWYTHSCCWGRSNLSLTADCESNISYTQFYIEDFLAWAAFTGSWVLVLKDSLSGKAAGKIEMMLLVAVKYKSVAVFFRVQKSNVENLTDQLCLSDLYKHFHPY